MTPLPHDRWVGIYAHPDDEWLAGWPVFQDPLVQRSVIFFVGDNRPGGGAPRARWESRLHGLCAGLDIDYLGCLDLPPEFYRSDRRARVAWRRKLERLLVAAGMPAARITTHNPMGEYGHPDHLEVHRAVLDVVSGPVVVTDLAYGVAIPAAVRRLYYAGPSHGDYVLQSDTWATARDAYRSQLRWTAREWPGQEVARLHEI